jgi:hypothetical protein
MNTSNLTQIADDLTPPSIDQLLAHIGFSEWIVTTTTFVLPAISLIGILLCSLSVWIFFRKEFKDPVFFYYRLLCAVYIVHLIHSILRGLLFTPKYFPNMNSYLSAIYQIYYGLSSSIFFHYEETLQIAIVLDRMTIYNSFVKKHFTLSPRHVSFYFFLWCLLINLPIVFALNVGSLGTYYYYDWGSSIRRYGTFYFLIASDFSGTLLGKILVGFTYFFLNIFLSLSFGLVLNIYSLVSYKSYLKQRRERVAEVPNNNVAHSSTQTQPLRSVSKREMNENRAAKNMLYMALTLSSFSILSRILLISFGAYFYLFPSFTADLLLAFINDFMCMLMPTLAIFVFYFFNKIFRQEFNKTFCSENLNSNEST